MKNVILIILVAAITLLAIGCAKTADVSASTVTFYYIHNEPAYGTESGVIAANTIEVNQYERDYNQLLATYFNGPTNYDCVSPFPAGITLEELYIDENKAQLVLSPHMATISGSDLTVALACLTRTVIEMTDVKTVQIRISGNQINGEDSVTFTLNSFSQFDEVGPN